MKKTGKCQRCGRLVVVDYLNIDKYEEHIKKVEQEAYDRGAKNQAVLDVSAIEEARKEVITKIRKWTKGRVLTKDKLRAFLNTLKKNE